MAHLIDHPHRNANAEPRGFRLNGFSLGWRRVFDVISAIEPLARSSRSLSFAQFGEDVLLSVCVFPRSKGFYVDVGAYHPWRNSNTYKLYLRGWSGLTIEPNPAAQRLFRHYRARDLHIVAGVAEKDEFLTYWQFRDPKLNTFSQDLASTYEKRGDRRLGEISVPCRPLQDIIDEFAPGVPIDLMSIDCEGFDFVVLRTIDFKRSRPAVILIEDFDAFEYRKGGDRQSEIEAFLRDVGYMPVSQAVYSTLYVDIAAARARHHSAFDFSAIRTVK